MRLLYDGKSVGKIITNRDLSFAEAYELLNIDINEEEGGDPVWDYTLFELVDADAKRVFEASLTPTGTTDSEGNYCEYQWCERDLIKDADNASDYVASFDDIEILDNVTVHNMPTDAIVYGQNGIPLWMAWEEPFESLLGE